ncbi:MAG TPA: 4-alpha-glucanotransferase, partial [Chloroflexota bacterium]|nr:4-alpha-glucanotransferase [Chloroflexota bacterium]
LEGAALAGVLRHLAASPADLVLVNLEDLWRETAAQNVPGTWRERPNWRRKARYSLEELSRLADAAALLGWVRAGRAAARDRYG